MTDDGQKAITITHLEHYVLWWAKNGTHCAISSFVTMFSKSRLLRRHQKASIWGKGLSNFFICNNVFNSLQLLLLFSTYNKSVADDYFKNLLEKILNFNIIRESLSLKEVENIAAKSVIALPKGKHTMSKHQAGVRSIWPQLIPKVTTLSKFPHTINQKQTEFENI